MPKSKLSKNHKKKLNNRIAKQRTDMKISYKEKIKKLVDTQQAVYDSKKNLEKETKVIKANPVKQMFLKPTQDK